MTTRIVIVNGIPVTTANYSLQVQSTPVTPEASLQVLSTPEVNVSSPRKKWKSTRKCFKERKIQQMIKYKSPINEVTSVSMHFQIKSLHSV